MNYRRILKATKVVDFLYFYFVLWLTDITAAALLGYLAAITLGDTATKHDVDLIHACL